MGARWKLSNMSLEVSSLRALAHPVRLRILSLLTGAPMSAAEVARELDITQANASYHLRNLARAGLVVEAGQEKIRGGMAKKYRHPPQSGAPRHESTPEDRHVAWQAMAHELTRRAGLEDTAPSDSTRGLLCDAEFWVEPEVWARARALVHEASALLHSSAKAPRGAGTIFVNAQMAMFKMRDPKEEK